MRSRPACILGCSNYSCCAPEQLALRNDLQIIPLIGWFLTRSRPTAAFFWSGMNQDQKGAATLPRRGSRRTIWSVRRVVEPSVRTRRPRGSFMGCLRCHDNVPPERPSALGGTREQASFRCMPRPSADSARSKTSSSFSMATNGEAIWNAGYVSRQAVRSRCCFCPAAKDRKPGYGTGYANTRTLRVWNWASPQPICLDR